MDAFVRNEMLCYSKSCLEEKHRFQWPEDDGCHSDVAIAAQLKWIGSFREWILPRRKAASTSAVADRTHVARK